MDNQFEGPTNQNYLKSPKRIRKRCYKTQGTSVINGPMSPPSLVQNGAKAVGKDCPQGPLKKNPCPPSCCVAGVVSKLNSATLTPRDATFKKNKDNYKVGAELNVNNSLEKKDQLVNYFF